MKMLEFLKQSCLFLFGDSNAVNLDYPYLVFLFSTTIIGLLCVFADFAIYKTTNGKSIFKLSYIGKQGTLLMFLFWGVGAGIVGFLSARLELVALSIQASVLTGLGWPLLFPKLVTYATTKFEEIEPEEDQTTESENEPE